VKKKGFIILTLLAVLATGLLIYPHITIETEDRLIAFRYSDDTSEFETEISADECYTYYEDRDVTWSSFDFKKFGPFYVLVFDTEQGNTIQSKYALDPEYMDQFLADAVIEAVEKDYKEILFTKDDIASMIAGKTPVEGGGRYSCHDYDAATRIYYSLDGVENFMSIFEADDLLVIQVGYSDEGPKFIAYE